MNCRCLIAMLLLLGFTSGVFAQTDTNCTVNDQNVVYPSSPLNYPTNSDQYAVQYKLGDGNWSNATVYISYYGQTLASPFNTNSGYISNKTSMSFVSIPAAPNTAVYLRVTNLNSNFTPADNLSIRPSAKPVSVNLAGDGTAMLFTTTASDFNGEQFLLWWGNATNGGNVESLVFFLDPPYAPPTSGKIATITNYLQLTNLNNNDALIFQGTVILGGTGDAEYNVPANITNVFFAPGSWVKGKLHFKYGSGALKRIYGPGVLDGSEFNYAYRACSDDQGDESLSFDKTTNTPADTFQLDGVIISDHNHAATDPLFNGAINNVKSLGWNGLNGGFRLLDNTTASNVFLRSGDDSLMMWGTNVTVRNATIWQDYNGAAVNIGWGADSAGDYCLVDGLYVVKTDWSIPTSPTFNKTNLDGQNDAVIVSLLTPGTTYGQFSPPLFRNILVDDSPNILFSLKIVFPECNDLDSPRYGDCALADLTAPSLMNLNVENVCTPASISANSFGFLTLPSGFSYQWPDGTTNTFAKKYTLNGVINIGLTNIFITSTNGTVNPLTADNAFTVGDFITNAANDGSVNIAYGFSSDVCLPCLPRLSTASSGSNIIVTWPTNFPGFALETTTNLSASAVWQPAIKTPTVTNGLNVITNSTSASKKFYRLSL